MSFFKDFEEKEKTAEHRYVEWRPTRAQKFRIFMTDWINTTQVLAAVATIAACATYCVTRWFGW